MQNLLSDINPEFAVPELAYIAEFDINTNGYDFRVGPCCNPRLQNDPQVHRTGWVPLEEIHEKDLHPDLFVFSFEEEDDIDEVSSDEPDPGIVTALAEFRQQYPTDAWGVEQRRPPRDAQGTSRVKASPKRAGVQSQEEDPLEQLRNFNEFPGIIGAHKFAELRHPKLCTLKRACKHEESHGKRGRKKTFWWSTLAREHSGKRELSLSQLSLSD